MRLRALPVRERAWLAAAWILLLLVRPLLAVVSLAALERRPCGDHLRVGVDRLTWLVAVAARHAPWGPTCLEQALVLVWILRRGGVPAVLRIGVARGADTLEAHAWVEHEGRTLLGAAAAARYAPLVGMAARRGA